MRLGPDDDEAEVTAAQVRDVIARLIEAGHWSEGDPPILVIEEPEPGAKDGDRLSVIGRPSTTYWT